MRIAFIALFAAATLMSGCSKKTAPAPEASAATEVDTKAAPATSQENPMIAAALDDVNRKIQQQQYDAAVGALVTMQQMPKSETQEAQFRARLRDTEGALLKKAQQGDVAAQQSAQMLGRMITGR
jgi:PBP1b-binding outer membrane lipoprotein LpoB